jgi:hypothetical protein
MILSRAEIIRKYGLSEKLSTNELNGVFFNWAQFSNADSCPCEARGEFHFRGVRWRAKKTHLFVVARELLQIWLISDEKMMHRYTVHVTKRKYFYPTTRFLPVLVASTNFGIANRPSASERFFNACINLGLFQLFSQNPIHKIQIQDPSLTIDHTDRSTTCVSNELKTRNERDIMISPYLYMR